MATAIDGHRVNNVDATIVKLVGKKIRMKMEPLLSMTSNGAVWDDVRGGWLETDRIKKAREEEMKFVRQRKVYDRMPWQEALQKTGKPPIKLRWVDTNKGDDR